MFAFRSGILLPEVRLGRLGRPMERGVVPAATGSISAKSFQEQFQSDWARQQRRPLNLSASPGRFHRAFVKAPNRPSPPRQIDDLSRLALAAAFGGIRQSTVASGKPP